MKFLHYLALSSFSIICARLVAVQDNVAVAVGNKDDTAVSVAFFVLFAVGLVTGYLDYVTTELGFTVGFTEKNPVARWWMATCTKIVLLIRKLRKKASTDDGSKTGHAVAAYSTLVGFVVSSVALFMLNNVVGCVFAGGIAGLESYNSIRNYLMYRKQKATGKNTYGVPL